DLRFLRVIPIKPSRSDNVSIVPVDHDKCSAALDRIFEENSEDILFKTISLRMLLPNDRIGRHREKIVPICRREWPKLDQFAFQSWLKIKCHVSGCVLNNQSSTLDQDNVVLSRRTHYQGRTRIPIRMEYASGFAS